MGHSRDTGSLPSGVTAALIAGDWPAAQLPLLRQRAPRKPTGRTCGWAHKPTKRLDVTADGQKRKYAPNRASRRLMLPRHNRSMVLCD